MLRLTRSPCIEWRFIVLEVILTKFPVSIDKSHLDGEGHGSCQTTKDCLDVVLKPTEYSKGGRKHRCLRGRHLCGGTPEGLQP